VSGRGHRRDDDLPPDGVLRDLPDVGGRRARQSHGALGHPRQALPRRRAPRAEGRGRRPHARGVELPIPDGRLAPPGLVRRRDRRVPRRDREPPLARAQPRRGGALCERPLAGAGVEPAGRRAHVGRARGRTRRAAMSAPALALVAPAAPGIAPATPLLGLPLARRTALAAPRAGFARVVAVGADEALAAALVGTGTDLATAAPPDALRLPWNVVVHLKDLRALASGEAASVGVPVTGPADLPRAERHLLRALIKDEEGFMSRHLDP